MLSNELQDLQNPDLKSIYNFFKFNYSSQLSKYLTKFNSRYCKALTYFPRQTEISRIDLSVIFSQLFLKYLIKLFSIKHLLTQCEPKFIQILKICCDQSHQLMNSWISYFNTSIEMKAKTIQFFQVGTNRKSQFFNTLICDGFTAFKIISINSQLLLCEIKL